MDIRKFTKIVKVVILFLIVPIGAGSHASCSDNNNYNCRDGYAFEVNRSDFEVNEVTVIGYPDHHESHHMMEDYDDFDDFQIPSPQPITLEMFPSSILEGALDITIPESYEYYDLCDREASAGYVDADVLRDLVMPECHLLGVESRVNYLSVAEAFEATERQASELLEKYKFYQSNDSAESQFAIFRIKQGCSGLRFKTQEDLDRWMAEDKWSRGRDAVTQRATINMRRFARCRKMIAYVGDKELDKELTVSALVEAAEKGHPVAKLIVQRSELKPLDKTEVTKLFSGAYAYSRDYPQYRAGVYGVAKLYLSEPVVAERNHTAYLALMVMEFRDGVPFGEDIDSKTVDANLRAVLQDRFLPIEIDQILAKATEISKAIENGDWSWLDSET